MLLLIVVWGLVKGASVVPLGTSVVFSSKTDELLMLEVWISVLFMLLSVELFGLVIFVLFLCVVTEIVDVNVGFVETEGEWLRLAVWDLVDVDGIALGLRVVCEVLLEVAGTELPPFPGMGVGVSIEVVVLDNKAMLLIIAITEKIIVFKTYIHVVST